MYEFAEKGLLMYEIWIEFELVYVLAQSMNVCTDRDRAPLLMYELAIFHHVYWFNGRSGLVIFSIQCTLLLHDLLMYF